MSKELKSSLKYITENVQNEQCFSVPENYFETIEDSLKMALIEENFPTNEGFDTPEGYFNSIEEKVFTSIESSKKEAKVISIKSRLLRLIPIASAASIALFLSINYFYSNDTISFDKLSNSDVEQWIDTDYIDLESTNSVFVDTDFEENNLIEDALLSDEELIDYFSEINSETLLIEIDS